jgi:5-methylcytosine-specific restriction endonuclease McrA
VTGQNPEVIRKDVYGSVMQWEKYGDCSSAFGWQIDHIIPLARGGSDTLDNMQPMHWENNQYKADRMPTVVSLLSGLI